MVNKMDSKHLDFFCQKVMPLVYDESLSYYEVLCKAINKLNELIDNYDVNGEAMKKLQAAVKDLEDWRDNFDQDEVEKIIKRYIANMIYVGISDAGYIIYFIPESWQDIIFNTTGLDITDDELSKDPEHLTNYEYGRLVLSMWTKEGE
jgi:hypothetical protein